MQIIKGKTGDWEVIIGLEVHAQISSKTKLFSNGSCEFGNEPNSSVNLFDAAMPGTLPVLNFSCVEKAVRTGLAVKGKINLHSVFERKHYFYPDLPHGYQITQQHNPIITGGKIFMEDSQKEIRIHHIHMETDAGKSIHDLSPDKTYIDLNRAGIPLMEIVSEPDMQSSKEALEYATKLRLILQYIGSSSANMEKGELRCDANVSVRKVGSKELGVRCEIKNLNSLKSLVQAIDYEANRQVELIESGEKITKDTRLFDANLIQTRSMRSKEEATDYRYFPDPDLLPLALTEEYIKKIAENLPELPDEKEDRYINQLGLTSYDAKVIVNNIKAANYFDFLIKEEKHDPKLVARWLTTELFGILNKNNIKFDDLKISTEYFSELMLLIEKDIISDRTAKDILSRMINENVNPRKIVEEENLAQITDEKIIRKYVISVLENNQDKVKEYLSGKDKLFAFFVGQIMKETGGKASPNIINNLLKDEINKYQ